MIARPVALARALAVCALTGGGSIDARAEPLDPSTPRFVAVGAPRGPAPSDRVDAARSGRARDELPSAPVELWNHRATGGVEVSPVVDDAGAVYVALMVPDLLKVTREGQKAFQVRLGAHAAATPPLLTSAGAVLVVTTGGQALLIGPDGGVRATTTLSAARGVPVDATPVALRDGGAVIAIARTLVALDGGGAVRARVPLDDRAAGALLTVPDPHARAGDVAEGVLYTTDAGVVFLWRPPAAPRRLGTFSGQVRSHGGAALADARTLLAVVDGTRLVALDLATGVAHVRLSVAPGSPQLDGPPATSGPGIAYVSTKAGLFVGMDPVGNERVRSLLEKTAPPSPVPLPPGPYSAGGSSVAPIEYKSSPPFVVDAAGRAAFARFAGRVGVVAPDGSVAVATERACTQPVALVPSGRHRFLVACRDGWLFTYGDRADRPAAAAAPAEPPDR